ncbi:MAG: hypothetical protein Q4G68_05550 [Planctomycetia bacterium]|nr:hypothetical protein [Planctomycetia bacterium]
MLKQILMGLAFAFFATNTMTSAEDVKGTFLDMFRGTIDNVSFTQRDEAPVADTVNPAECASRALGYLNGNPMPEHNWQCQFSLGPLGIPCLAPIVPANEFGVDPVSLGDTDLRMELQFSHMKEMCGRTEETDAERGVRNLVRAYQKDDGFCWCNPSAATGTKVEGLWVMTWAMQFELRSLCDEFRRTHAETARTAARELIEGFKKITLYENELAYVPGIAPWRDGVWLRVGWCQEHARQYPQLIESLVDYAETFDEAEALTLACAYADGILATVQKDMNELRVDPETGSFRGHSHMHSNVFWGMAHLGEVTGQAKYTNWAKIACEKMWETGTDFGWIPEYSPDSGANEICVLGDFVPASLYLAKTVGPYWYDRVDRIVRNTLVKSQFTVTKEFESLFRSLHKNVSEEEIQKALNQVRRLEGGFVAQSSFYGDWVAFPAEMGTTGMYTNGIQMMGCCPPSGMQALWAWWRAAIEARDDGIYVNFALTRDSEWGQLTSYSAADGRLDITCKKGGNWYLRIPGWTIRESAKLTRNDKSSDLTFGGPDSAYVVVKGVEPGEQLTLTWPVPTFTQTVTYHGQELQLHWTGPEVTAMRRPEKVFLPMYPAPKNN